MGAEILNQPASDWSIGTGPGPTTLRLHLLAVHCSQSYRHMQEAEAGCPRVRRFTPASQLSLQKAAPPSPRGCMYTLIDLGGVVQGEMMGRRTVPSPPTPLLPQPPSTPRRLSTPKRQQPPLSPCHPPDLALAPSARLRVNQTNLLFCFHLSHPNNFLPLPSPSNKSPRWFPVDSTRLRKSR